MRASVSDGFSLIELVIAIGLFIIFVAGVSYLALGDSTPFVGGANTKEEERFAQEVVEAINIIKDRSWKNIVDNSQACDLGDPIAGGWVVNKDGSGNWRIYNSGVDETRGSFTRNILIFSVKRDGSGNIVTDCSSGTDDPSTKFMKVTVSSTGRANYVLNYYFTNIEAYPMIQTGWSGSSGQTTWTDGSADWYSSSQMGVSTTSGQLMLGKQ